MRHKYHTQGIVLSRSPLGETNALLTLLTPELGIVRARAQGIRRPGAKLAGALTTFSESQLILVRGAEGWRVAGAVLEENWLVRMNHVHARTVATRITGLLLRLVAGEAQDRELYPIIRGFFRALGTLSTETYDIAEVLAALRILKALGYDEGDVPGASAEFSPAILTHVRAARTEYIARINHRIAASEL